MESTENEMPISQSFWHYLAVAQRWAWQIVLCMLLSGAAFYIANKLTAPVYQANTRLLINESSSTKANENYNAILSGERQARTYVKMITNRPLLESVIAELNLPMSPVDLASAITVELVTDTRLIDITVESSAPQQAAAIANQVAEDFVTQLETLEKASYQVSKRNLQEQIDLINQQIQDAEAALANVTSKTDETEVTSLRTTLLEYRQTYASLVQSLEEVRMAEVSASSGVVLIEPAIPVDRPIRPKTMVNTFIGIIAGGVLAVLLAFLFDMLDDTIRTAEDVKQHLGLPIYGLIPSHVMQENQPITLTQPLSPICDSYRSLRANIHFAGVDQPIKTILITSTNSTEGKTTLVTNLGVVLAQNQLRTAIIDTDFRRSAVNEYMGLPNEQGLSNLFVDKEIAPDRYLQEIAPHLKVLVTGSLPPNPTELLASEKMVKIIQSLSKEVDILLIDTPPLLAFADAAVIASRVDGVLFVIKPGVSRIAAVRQSIEQLKHARANLLGVVLNDVNIKQSHYYGRYYSNYNDYYGDKKKPFAFLKRLLKKKAVS